jgi:ATP-dependent Clp protease ATP-binding subunit ClpA
MSRYDHYDAQAREVLTAARAWAANSGRDACTADDLAMGLLVAAAAAVNELLAGHGLVVATDKIKAAREQATVAPPPTVKGGPSVPPPAAMGLAPDLRAVLDQAERLTQGLAKGQPVTPRHLLCAGWAALKPSLKPFVAAAGRKSGPVDLDAVAAPANPPARPQSRTAASGAASLLARFANEVTAQEHLQDAAAREREIGEMVAVLLRRDKPNVMLLGEPGVGKTALVEGLALRIRKGRVPKALAGSRIFSLPVGNLLAGTSTHGSFEQRMRDLVTELEATPGAILFLDEAHMLNAPGRGSYPGDHLKPALARGRFRCIAATTSGEFYRHLQGDGALVRRFTTVTVSEPDAAATLTMLRERAPTLVAHYGIELSERLLVRAVELGRDILCHRRFPDKALDVLETACAAAVARGATALAASDLDAVAGQMVGVHLGEGDGLTQGLATLETSLATRVLGQPEAIRAMTRVLRLCKRRLDLRPERPDGVFLFTGPSGVGKTALAEALAEVLCGSREQLERFDMGEFAESYKISRLVGSPPGYIGYGGEPELTRAARRHPNGVLLLDEFEKAHPDVQRLFLQVFDTGRLTDSAGEVASFANMTIVLTANLPAAREHEGIGFGGSGASVVPKPADEAERLGLRKYLPAELISRLDAVVPFRPLSRELAGDILTQRLLAQANETLRQRWSVEIEMSGAAVEALLDAGFSAELGVRDLQRRFEELVMLPLAELLPAIPPEPQSELRRLKADLAGGKVSLAWVEGIPGTRLSRPPKQPRRRARSPRQMPAAA